MKFHLVNYFGKNIKKHRHKVRSPIVVVKGNVKGVLM